ncbi:MAG: hypothetical protein L3K26_15655 [Candidatus Hydrogenedentes bacterium]|nr:hypothetical protein [Candidatus Hydrogenedentota bacterium]
MDDTVQFEMAITWYATGADFADAMHFSACSQAAMYTFNRDFCKQARELEMTPEIQVIQA